MKSKTIMKKVAMIVMSLAVLMGVGSIGKSSVKASGYATTYEYGTAYLSRNRDIYVPISRAIKVSSVSSSNRNIATISSKRNAQSRYVINMKKKGKVTFTFVAGNSGKTWAKGDKFKYILTIKQ